MSRLSDTPPDLRAATALLAEWLVDDGGPEDLCAYIADLVTWALPGVDRATVTLAGGPRTGGSTTSLPTITAPIGLNGNNIGELALWSSNGRPRVDHSELTEFASQAATVLTNTVRFGSVRTRGDQLEQAVLNRATIEQAKGVLIATYGISPDAAFALLVRESQNANVKLRTVAHDVVATAASGQPVRLRVDRSRLNGGA